MSIVQHSMSSHTGNVSVQRPSPELGKKWWTLKAASVAMLFLSMVPVVGSVFGFGSYLPASKANKLQAQAEHDSLAKHFSTQIAERFNIHPDQVTREHLYELAKRDQAFAKILEPSMRDKGIANRNSGISAGVSGIIPGAGMVAQIGTELALSTGASIFDKNNLTVPDVTDHIEAKIAGGELVTADDLMLLRVAQNDTLAEEIKASYGDQFHKLDAEKRVQVLEAMPALFETANRDSNALNNGLVKTQDLAIEHAPAPAKWSAGATSRSQQAAKQNGFRAKLEADRAAARAAQQQL